jgi:REP element-mobilizing transposase RayT
VPDGALFFVTVCAKIRRVNSLALPNVAPVLIESVRHRNERGDWFARLFLIMPDHVHALLAVPPHRALQTEIRGWKRYTAKAAGVIWQDGFFEHRIRPEEQSELKARYIREKPVRARLEEKESEWPWVWTPDAPVHLD